MKKICRCICFALIVTIVVCHIYKVLSYKVTTDEDLSSVSMLYNTEDNLIDAVFLGTSHTYCSIYPSVMWNEYGISAFDMSISGQDKDSTYHAIIEVLKTQSPKVVFVDIYGMLFDLAFKDWLVYRNYLTFNYSKNSYEHVKDGITDNPGDFLLRFPIIHTRYKELIKTDFISYSENEYRRGESLGWRIQEGYTDPEGRLTEAVEELSEKNKNWLEKLKKLSEDEGFELVLFIAPFSIIESQQQIFNGAKQFAAENGIAFYDLNNLYEEIGLDYGQDMLDVEHTNGWGATKVSAYLAEILAKEYGLSDHRGDSKYYQWDLNYERYAHSLAENELAGTIRTDWYLEKAMGLKDVAVYESLEGDCSNITEYLYTLGFSEEDIALGGKWIYEDGVRTKLMDNVGGTLINREYSDFDNVLVQYIDDNRWADILVNGQSVVQVENGLNIIVYDKLTNTVLGTKSIAN